MLRLKLICAGLLCATALTFLPNTAFAQSANSNPNVSQKRVGFTISIGDIESDLSIAMTTVMPSATVSIKTDATPSITTGALRTHDDLWHWTAPSVPGRHEMTFEQNGETILLHIFVLTPFTNTDNAQLNGYKIGSYSKTLFKGLSNYQAPKGFIDLSHGPASLRISPSFTLGQFICKQQAGYSPTYLLVRPETLIKLETLLEAANEKGWKGDSFHIMSGFRTPYYNLSIGNKTSSSRHLYGGAADIWLDGDGDGQMDDLNRDGKINKDDARELAKLAETLAQKGGRNWPSGGVGVYGSNAAHGPFVHIDSRGYRARWGH